MMYVTYFYLTIIISNVTMFYRHDSPTSDFSQFSDDPQIPQRQISGYFSDFEEEEVKILNQPLKTIIKDQNIQIINKMGQKQTKDELFMKPYPGNLTMGHQKLTSNNQRNRTATYSQTQINKLRQENSILRQLNSKLAHQLSQQKKKSSSLQTRQQQQLKKLQFLQKQLNQIHQQNEKQQSCNKKQKIESLLTELSKMKQTVSMLKQEAGYYHSENNKLVRKLKIVQSQGQNKDKEGQQWKKQFLGMFVDMTKKLCPQMEDGWSRKKCVQIGWKVIKNMINKACLRGVKPPKLEKSVRQETN